MPGRPSSAAPARGRRGAIRAGIAIAAMVIAGTGLALLVLVGTLDDRARLQAAAALTGGSPDRGANAIRLYGCGACHEIAGIAGAQGRLGPSLVDFRQRAFIAGRVPNRPDMLLRWIADPWGVDPQTAMPRLDIRQDDARDIAAYLYAH